MVGAQDPSWSPDGTKIAFAGTPEGSGSQWDIYVMNPDGSGQMPLTNCALMFNASCYYPRWSSDGKQIVFEVNSPSGNSIYKMNSDGSNVFAAVTDLRAAPTVSIAVDAQVLASSEGMNFSYGAKSM